MQKGPTLSVVVNNYNYGRFLAAALDSALAQLAPGDELIVVDDGSTDDSGAVLERYAERPNVRLIRQANQGQVAAVLRGLEAARGELITLLDSDDEYLDGYLDRLRACARAQPAVDFFFCRAAPAGPAAGALATTARTLARMHFAEGPVGSGRCATLLFGEFLGSPTSGLALRAGLAAAMLAVSDGLRAPSRGAEARGHEPIVAPATLRRLSADGLLVRLASALGAGKYSLATAGFRYRIHGGNVFASLSPLARLRLRARRVNRIARLVAVVSGSPRRPPLQTLRDEAHTRATPLHGRRRVMLAVQYGLAALFARGPLWRRLLSSPGITVAMLRLRPQAIGDQAT